MSQKCQKYSFVANVINGKEKMETGRIRNKEKNQFTMVSNRCLQDKNLSLKAKGLFSIIKSLIDIPNFVVYKTYIQNVFCSEGKDAFNSAWKELLDKGYLIKEKINTSKGAVYEYELVSNPKHQDNSDDCETEGNPDIPDTDFPTVGSPNVDSPCMENATPNKTNQNKTKVNQTKVNNDVKKTRKLISLERKRIIDDNLKFTPVLEEEDVPFQQKYVDNFLNERAKQKTNDAFIDRGIFARYLMICESLRSNDVAERARKLLIDSINSFYSSEELIQALRMNEDHLLFLFDKAAELVQGSSKTPVGNAQSYLSTIIRGLLESDHN